MSVGRRHFLFQSAGSLGLGAVASLAQFSPVFAQDSSMDGDSADLKSLTKQSGNYDIGLSENLSKEVNWSYQNSKGELFTKTLASHGDSLAHAENPLITWYYDENDHFEQADIYSQVDEKFATLIKNNEGKGFHSMAVVQCTDEKLQLLGVISADQLMNDPEFPLPYVTSKHDSLGYVAAIGSVTDTDVFTCLFASARFLVAVAIDNQGLSRTLFAIDAADDGQNVMDVDSPQYVLTPGFNLSLPKHNLANDGKHSVLIRCGHGGLFLMNIEENGLKLVTKFYDADTDGSDPFLTFPTTDYDWHFQTEPNVHTFSDRFLQPLYNMGADKETLLHWQTNDGHHAFVAIHKGDDGQYDVHPKALMRANEAVYPSASWVMRPQDKINSFVSSSHGDAADKIVLWNGVNGCAVLSLEQNSDGTYETHQLKHIPIGGKFHDHCDFTFESNDEFFYPNHMLTQKRRDAHAKLFAATKTKLHATKNSDGSENDAPRYRMHVRSRAHEKTFSLDFMETTEKPAGNLLSAQPSKTIRFKELSVAQPLPSKEKKDLPLSLKSSEDLNNVWAIPHSNPADTADVFVDTYLKHNGYNDYHSSGSEFAHLKVIDLDKLKDALDKTCNYLRGQSDVDAKWISDFKDQVNTKVSVFNDRGTLCMEGVYLGTMAGVGIPVWAIGARTHFKSSERFELQRKDYLKYIFSDFDKSQEDFASLTKRVEWVAEGNSPEFIKFPDGIQKMASEMKSKFDDLQVKITRNRIIESEEYQDAVQSFRNLVRESQDIKYIGSITRDHTAILKVPPVIEEKITTIATGEANSSRPLTIAAILCVGLIAGAIYALSQNLEPVV